MGDSAEPSARFDFSEDDSRIPSEDEEKKKYSLGKKGNSVGLAKMFRSRGRRSDYKEEKGVPEEKGGSRTRSDYEEVEDLSELQGIGIQRYDYMVLHKATQGFNDGCKIGEDSSGVLYGGMLKTTQAVAVKLLSVWDHRESISLYITEVKALSQVRHRNVVQLLGWCRQAGHLALVFEFMPNLSLEYHLNGYNDLPSLPWKVRYSTIALGIASALLYLQEGLERCVIHRNIRPSNIWLDSDFNPKLAAFQLSIVADCGGPDAKFLNTPFEGTPGYVDQLYVCTGKLPKASDIYSFGVVALQIASGRKAIIDFGEYKQLPEWVEELHEKGRILEAVDPKLGDDFDKGEAERLLLVGLWCTQWDPKSRPSIKLILQLLGFEVPIPHNFISNVCGILREHEIPSSPDRTWEESNLFCRGVDIDATTASMKSRINKDTFNNIEADDLLLESLQDNYQDDELTPALSLELDMFDIGIPPDFGLLEIENYRNDHHRNILKGFVNSLHEMIQSEENMPQFEDAPGKIKICTAALVVTVGPPLNDWNTLAQLVLRYLKERENFFKFHADHASVIDNVTMLSLNEGMHKCFHTIKEDKRKLKDSKERRSHAQQKCTSLEAELAKAQGILFSIEEDIKAVEERIIENLSLLQQRRRHYAILKQYENLLSEISSFTS